ncbi:MFS general substrate transporter [Suillus paluster]|uniref:MFS general substrate transporter n=1 Tax=Suillus paluster TaxID=48578 RepID=UPI001B8620BD|nr:MFS general substrate transporter [Suillus paluster]KAG1740852.1 MFS general substrate transporter [Suillus paluster]
MPPLPPVADTLVHKRLSLAHKLALLAIFCLARFLDSFSTTALFDAILKLSNLGALSLCAGFIDTKIPLIILRALTGIVSSTTITSALALLVKVFPDPLEQAWAIGIFVGCGAIAAVSGLMLGAMFVQWVSFHWVFWFVACAAFPVALVCIFIIPSHIAETAETEGAKWKSLDLVGVVAFILFIFTVTSGSTEGWKSPMVLVLLIVPTLPVAGFFYWETLLPVGTAAIPPRTWFYKNFSVLFAVALLPYFWWNTMMTMFSTMWQNVFNWSVISTAVYIFFTGSLSRIFSPKWLILTGLSLCMVATPENYWPYVFPSFSLGTAGSMFTFGLTIASIEASVEATHGGLHEYNGRAATCWFILGFNSFRLWTTNPDQNTTTLILHYIVLNSTKKISNAHVNYCKSLTKQPT